MNKVIDFLTRLNESKAKQLLCIDPESQILVGESKVYLKHDYDNSFLYLNEKLEIVNACDALIEPYPKYQLIFVKDKTQFGYNTRVYGNTIDNRTKLGFRILTGKKILFLLENYNNYGSNKTE